MRTRKPKVELGQGQLGTIVSIYPFDGAYTKLVLDNGFEFVSKDLAIGDVVKVLPAMMGTVEVIKVNQ